MTGHEHKLVGNEVDAFDKALAAAYDALSEKNGGISILKMLRMTAALHGQMIGASHAQGVGSCTHCAGALQAIMESHAKDGMIVQAKFDAIGTA